MLVVEPESESTSAHCEECDHVTRKIVGFISDEHRTRAAYLARWTDGHIELGAQIILSIGVWGEDAVPSERSCVAIECHMGDGEDRPSFTVIDANNLDRANDEMLGQPVTRADVLSTPLAQEAFAMLDALTEQEASFRAFLLNEPSN